MKNDLLMLVGLQQIGAVWYFLGSGDLHVIKPSAVATVGLILTACLRGNGSLFVSIALRQACGRSIGLLRNTSVPEIKVHQGLVAQKQTKFTDHSHGIN